MVNTDQSEESNKEKQQKYNPVIPFYIQKHHMENIKVVDSVIGSGRTINKRKIYK